MTAEAPVSEDTPPVPEDTPSVPEDTPQSASPPVPEDTPPGPEDTPPPATPPVPEATPRDLLTALAAPIFHARELGPYLRIATPFALPDGDLLALFIPRHSDPPLLVDLGETLRWLRSHLFHDPPERQQLRIAEVCADLGVELRGGELRTHLAPAGFVFHVVNAFDTPGGLEVQAVRYPELWRHDGGFDADGVLWSWQLDLARGTVTERQLDDRGVEFPRIDDRLAGLPARYGVAVGGDRLVRYDLTDGSAVERGFDGGRPGEAVFVPAADSSDESDGWYLAYIYDPARNGSDLVILDASDFTGDAVATIHLPQRVPYGFHGNWIQ